MRTNNTDLITFVVFLFVIVFLIGPFVRLVYGFLAIPPVTVATAIVGAVWFLSAAIGPLRGGSRRSTLGSTKVTYWRGQRIETRLPPRARVRAASNVQAAGALWYLALGVGCAYAAIITLLRLINVI